LERVGTAKDGGVAALGWLPGLDSPDMQRDDTGKQRMDDVGVEAKHGGSYPHRQQR
jgi:hypothetical protein